MGLLVLQLTPLRGLRKDGGVATAYGAKQGKHIAIDFVTRITEDDNDNPDRVRKWGDLVSFFDFQAKTVKPSKDEGIGGSYLKPILSHSFKGLSTPDKYPEHVTERNPLRIQPDDKFTIIEIA